MKVLQIINSLGTGGAEKLLLDTIPMYRAQGIEMDILLLWNNNHQFTTSLIKSNVCKVFILSESENVRDIYKPQHINSIAHILRNYDIAHVHLFPSQYFTALAKKLIKSNSKLIFTEHNTTNSRIAKTYFKPIEKWVYRRYDRLVCISDEIHQIFKDYLKFDSKYYSVIKNGVNLKAINNAAVISKQQIHHQLKEQDFLLTQISAFRPQKDQQTLIKALTHLPYNVKLALVGDGVTRAECEALVESLNLQDRVFFLGQRMDVPSLIVSSDIVVLSSHYEGLSLASIEGLASGKPFLASDVPGLRDIVNGAGLLFTEGDDKALADHVIRLMNDPDYKAEVVNRCMNRAAQYDIQHMIDAHIALYHEVYEN